MGMLYTAAGGILSMYIGSSKIYSYIGLLFADGMIAELLKKGAVSSTPGKAARKLPQNTGRVLIQSPGSPGRMLDAMEMEV